jgi:hypothetical protein
MDRDKQSSPSASMGVGQEMQPASLSLNDVIDGSRLQTHATQFEKGVDGDERDQRRRCWMAR